MPSLIVDNRPNKCVDESVSEEMLKTSWTSSQ